MAHPIFAGWLVSLVVYAFEGGSHGALLQITTPMGDAVPNRAATTPSTTLQLTTALSQKTVEMAIKHAGLAESAASALTTRSRLAALLPETRVRLAQSSDLRDDGDSTPSSSSPTSADSRFYWEGRAAWRLDHLIYSGDEPALERIRIDESEAKARVAHRALEALFAWERARLDAASGDSAEASLRLRESECTLDVLTGGWFSRRQVPPL